MEMTTVKPATIYPTLAKVLAYYDQACAGSNQVTFEDAAHVLAQHLRRPKPERAGQPADSPGTFTAGNFTAALKAICAVIERRNTIPVLSNVRLAASGGYLRLEGTDLDIHASAVLSGYDGPEFDLTTPAHPLAGMVKGAKALAFIPPGEDPRLGVVIDGATAHLPVLESGDFPVMQFEGAAAAFMDGAALADAFGFVATTISHEETRYYLNGLYMHSAVNQGQAQLVFVSTDGSRMSKQTMAAPAWEGEFIAALIPRKTVALMVKALGAGEVLVETNARAIRFTLPSGEVYTSKLIDGSFPDYNRVIPRGDDFTTYISVDDAKAFGADLARFAALSNERSRSIRLSLAGGDVTGTVRNMESGTVTGVMSGAWCDGTPREVGVNASYLADLVAAGCRINIGTADDPMLFEYANRPDRLAVLMPLRV